MQRCEREALMKKLVALLVLAGTVFMAPTAPANI
jgi:hypothetical protein